MCGEYLTTMVRLTPSRGSPPHVWRILQLILPIFKTEGITSTCVENTVRGFMMLMMRLGSPPHVWRILLAEGFIEKIGRITSTCVENTMLCVSGCICVRDHLHMCGEYQFISCCVKNLPGSPPHVWRIPNVPEVETVDNRITSTCVENTANKRKKQAENKDHLHMCGEYAIYEALRQDTGRITSTCVENTFM